MKKKAVRIAPAIMIVSLLAGCGERIGINRAEEVNESETGVNLTGERAAELSESQITSDADPKIVVDSPAIQMYDEFIYDNRLCTQEEWYEQTREYLYTDEEGRYQIRNQVEWLRYCE